MSGEAVAGKGLSLSSGMGAITAAEQQDTEDLPSWPRGCRVRSISTEKKAVGSPPTLGPPQKATKGIMLKMLSIFQTLQVPKEINL